MGGQGELRSWIEDDFVDASTSQPLVENDPWDPNAPSTSAPELALPERLGYESESNDCPPSQTWKAVGISSTSWPTSIRAINGRTALSTLQRSGLSPIQPSMPAANSASRYTRQIPRSRTSRVTSRSANYWRIWSRLPKNNAPGATRC